VPLRVGVPRDLVEHPSAGGDGVVWREVLARLDARVVVLGARLPRRVDVVLASGHRELPATSRPLVAQLHEAPWDDPEQAPLLDPSFRTEQRRRGAEAARRAARVLTAAESAAVELRALYAPRAIDVVPHGVDHARFRPGRPAADLGGPYVLFVGSNHPRKNLAALVQALRGRPERLVVAGGPAGDRAQAEPWPDGAHVEASPDDERVASLVAGAAVLVLPSLSEGFGLPALEALACGTPVVASRRGALPEVVGDAGVLVEPTPDGIAAGIDAALADPSLRERGPARAAGLSWERTAEGWLQSLHAAARGRR
jgi:glycosyltransferase involved in cell wall biosynthesis